MASKAYQDHGVIIIWFDESEQDGVSGDNADDFDHTIGEIIISEDARQSGGKPFASPVNFTHSSDLRAMENIFHVGQPYLGDAATAGTNDLSDLFGPGSIPRRTDETQPCGDRLKRRSPRPLVLTSGWFSRPV
jgi:hypothetical protein